MAAGAAAAAGTAEASQRAKPARAATFRDVTPAQIAEYQKPVFNLQKFFSSPVKIQSIELLQAHNQYFLRTRSTDGAEGIVQTKGVEDYISDPRQPRDPALPQQGCARPRASRR